MSQSPSDAAPRDAARPRPVYNIVGEKVALGPGSREEQIDLFYRGDNNYDVALFSGDPLRPRSREAFEADYDRDAKEPHPSWVGYLVYDRVTDTPIGGIGLRDIDLSIGAAELGISIGRKDYWGQGFGTEAITLLLDWGFTILGLYNVMLTTYAYNERALRSYRKIGFREIGRRREAQRLGDRRYDLVFMDLLRPEFHSPYKPVITLP
ncbi:MAG TPA: GNAT family protein [Ktedonobacterales bacterium]|jgi:RimJ/RimL family protein N-acetyltransferase|nr:GNAT family protein [Ktedonobacterales bacterium]